MCSAPAFKTLNSLGSDIKDLTSTREVESNLLTAIDVKKQGRRRGQSLFTRCSHPLGIAWLWDDLGECCIRPVSLSNICTHWQMYTNPQERSASCTHAAGRHEKQAPTRSETHVGDWWLQYVHACAHRHTCARQLSSALYWITLTQLAFIGLGGFFEISQLFSAGSL